MIVILRRDTGKDTVDSLRNRLEESLGIKAMPLMYEGESILMLSGDTAVIDESIITREPAVKSVVRLTSPYKLASRLYHPEDTIVDVKGVKVGGSHFSIIAGPCSIDSRATLEEIASSMSDYDMLRGGAFKPRTSPYAFQGIGIEGIDILHEVGAKYNKPIVSEITSKEHLDTFVEKVDIIQVGARNMQNYDLLKALGETDKPVLLKRGMASSVDELIMSAEYILAGGNPNVILCERGVRCVENGARATLDLTAVPVIKERTHLPVIVDPSHAAGRSSLIAPLSRAAVAVGADGIMLEVHVHPESSLSDGAQNITPDEFNGLMTSLRAIADSIGKEI